MYFLAVWVNIWFASVLPQSNGIVFFKHVFCSPVFYLDWHWKYDQIDIENVIKIDSEKIPTTTISTPASLSGSKTSASATLAPQQYNVQTLA